MLSADATPIAEELPAPAPKPVPVAKELPAPAPKPVPVAKELPAPAPKLVPVARELPAPVTKRPPPAARRTQDPSLLYQEAVHSESLARRRALLEQAIRLRPHFALAHIKLAGTLRTLGNRDGAIQHYREYLVLKPNAFDKDTVRAEIQKLGGQP